MAALLANHISLAIAGVVALGAIAQWIAWRARLPAILPLLLFGFFVGPVLGWIRPAETVPAGLLYPAISLAVGLILFEGGLTLRIPEVKEIRGVVLRLVTLGALVTFLAGTLAAYLLTDLPIQLAFLFGALIVVTGPTVIGPLLRTVRPEAAVANVLKWEGILIDAIGAMVAVLVFEFILIDNRNEAMGQTILLLLEFVLVGSVTGIVGGAALAYLLRRRFVPDYLVNVVALAAVFLVFSVANTLGPESGLLATVLMGVIVGNLGVPNINDLLSFKEDLTILFINVLFIVLAANIELAAFLEVLGLSSAALLAVIMLLIRPLAIFLSAARSPLQLNQKLYLSWIAPRGIVAASVSSLFAARLEAAGFQGAQTLVALVFLVIVGTVLLNSVTARPLGRLLGVADPDPQGFLIVGAHEAGRKIAGFLREQGIPVLLADTNWANVAAARAADLPTYYGSLLSERSDDEVRLSGIGRLLALTPNDEANALTALKYGREFGTQDVYQLEPTQESSTRKRIGGEQRGRLLFARGVSYRELELLANAGARFEKRTISGRRDLEKVLAGADHRELPMFVLTGSKIRVLTPESQAPEPGSTIVSLVAAPGPASDSKSTAGPA